MKEFMITIRQKQPEACAALLKKRLWHRCFPVNFVKFLRTPFLQNTSGRLLLGKSSVVEIQNLLVNSKSRPVKSNSEQYQFLFKYVSRKNQ